MLIKLDPTKYLTRSELENLVMIANRLNLPQELIERVYKNINNFRPYIRGVPGWAKIGGLLIYTAREIGYPLTLEEVAKAAQPVYTNKRQRRKIIYGVYSKLVEISKTKGVTPQPEAIIERIRERGMIPSTMAEEAKELAKEIEKRVSGVSRVTIAATAVYLIGRRDGSLRQRDVAEMFGITEASIRNLLRKLKNLDMEIPEPKKLTTRRGRRRRRRYY